MDYRKIVKNLVFLLAICSLVYFDIAYWGSGKLGFLLLLTYLIFLASGARAILSKFFGLSQKAFRIQVLGMFMGLVSLGWMLAPIIVFSRLTSAGIAAIFFINGALYIFLEQWAGASKKRELDNQERDFLVLEEVPQAKVGVFFYLLLAIYGFYLLYKFRTGAAISTPWQTIDPKFIYVFFFSTLILGFLIFSKLKAKAILFLLILHSFLLHSYLPLTHELFYGADGWRHLAIESRIIQEKPIDLVLYDQNSFLSKLDPGRFSYSQTWGISVVASRLLSIPLLDINIWLVPIIWSIILPILLFEIASALSFSKKQSLFFSWLGFLPFALQVGGSFTLPVNLGFLIWLISCILILKRLKSERREQLIILALFGIGLIFSYSLFFILFAVGLILAETYKKISLKYTVTAALFIIPLIEIVSRYSSTSFGSNFFAQIKQLIGNFSSFYLASGPRTHDIGGGNIIFNQTPSYAFIPNFFTQWRWWVVLFAIGFIGLAIVSLIKFFKATEAQYKWLAIFSLSIFSGYILPLYFLAGEHVLSRRLDIVIAFLMILLLFYSWIKFVFGRFPQIIAIILSVTVFSVATAASYSLGPDTSSVSKDQYEAVQYIWQQDQNYKTHCVLGDTYPLLALEAVSSKEIVGGGFPINQYFAQPERIELLHDMDSGLTSDIFKKASTLTGSNSCWVIADKDFFFEQPIGVDKKVFGKIAAVRYNIK